MPSPFATHFFLIRQALYLAFAPQAECIASVATAGIPQGVLVADLLDLPFVYVRPKPKEHGMGNLIEGKIEKGKKAVLVEDLISTGGSSLKAVEAIRAAGGEVQGLGAIFTYGFPKSLEAFAQANCKFFTLSDYPTLLEVAIKQDYIKKEEKETLLSWYQNPEEWAKSKV